MKSLWSSELAFTSQEVPKVYTLGSSKHFKKEVATS